MGFVDINLTQELLDDEQRRKVMNGKQNFEAKPKMVKEHHLALLDSFPDETLKKCRDDTLGMHL